MSKCKNCDSYDEDEQYCNHWQQHEDPETSVKEIECSEFKEKKENE